MIVKNELGVEVIPKKRLYDFSIAGRRNSSRCQQSECSLDEVVRDVEKIIEIIGRDYRRTKGLILSEDDLKCALYRKLSSMYSEPIPTLDQGISATALHTEMPWYDENNRLTLRPDLSIIDPRQLSILHGIGEHGVPARRNSAIHYRLPSKGYAFGGQAVAIEIKFVRSLTGISHRHIVSFQKDIDKMQRLCMRHNQNSRHPNVKGVLIIFSKTDKGKPHIDDFRLRNESLSDIRILFCSGGVQ